MDDDNAKASYRVKQSNCCEPLDAKEGTSLLESFIMLSDCRSLADIQAVTSQTHDAVAQLSVVVCF